MLFFTNLIYAECTLSDTMKFHFLYPFLQVGKATKLKPMEVELKRLEDLADAVVNDFAYMRQREQEMRDTNGRKINFAFLGDWL